MPKLKAKIAAVAGWRRLGLAASLGLLATAALPPVHLVFLLIPAFTGLMWLIDGAASRREAFFAVWWFGFSHFTSGVYWTAISMLVNPEKFAWMIPFALFGLPSLLALFPAAAALLLRLCRWQGGLRVLFFAAAWTLTEWVRSWILTGFPWNLMASAWTAFDPMMQFAAVGGAYGLGFVTIAAAAAPAALGGFALNRREGIAFNAAAFAALALIGAGGFWRLGFADDRMVANVRLRLVQPNIDQSQKWKPELRRQNVAKQLTMSISQPSPGSLSPTHIIWAETAAPFALNTEPQLLSALGAAAPLGGLLITGAPRITLPGEIPFQVWNSLYAIANDGQIAGIYDKFHLVPFGEYVPLRGLFKFSKLASGRGDFSPGPGLVTLDLPGLPPVSPLICYEIIFPGQVADRSRRPSWMLNITNDGWYGDSSGPYQHFASARLRAVEEGLPVVRVANTGISAVVDAYGRVRASLGLSREGIVDSGLPAHLENPTLYARFGEGVVLPILSLGILAGLLPLRRQKLTI